MSQAAAHVAPVETTQIVSTRDEIEELIVERLAAQAGRQPGELRAELRFADQEMPVDPDELRIILPELLAYFDVELKARELAGSLYYVAALARLIDRELSRRERDQTAHQIPRRPRLPPAPVSRRPQRRP